ncbi:MAG TPA: lipase family protein [Patescibacteria group bacterium]|nr:lipase family protein [Patescibacteria group bacterium]
MANKRLKVAQKLPSQFKLIPLFLILFALFLLVVVISKYTVRNIISSTYQDKIASFYIPPKSLKSTKPGTLIKKDALNIKVNHLKKAYRIMYVSQLPNGKPTISTGMIFIPDEVATESGRPVLAWAHGTSGMGPQCAPSRATNPLSDMNWLSDALANNWVVVATDYQGLGTPGTQLYLVGQSEARDVINSVRAAQNFPDSHANNNYLLWGHSQGGHSVFFTNLIGPKYAPELNLIAVAAAAPATEITSLLSKEYDNLVAWGLGSELAVSWPAFYGVKNSDVLTQSGLKNYKSVANKCLVTQTKEIELDAFLNGKFFKTNPLKLPSWLKVSQKETVPPLQKGSKPALVAQGLADTLVLPKTTAEFVNKSCMNNANLTTLWLPKVGHIEIANRVGKDIIAWLKDRLNGVETQGNCGEKLPV